jgi:pyruvate-ferredoxin/flavodoxin oxidoreductase
MLAMAYGSVYVARVAMGGSDMQTIKAFLEAEAYPGPSLILAFSHCIAHGYEMVHGLEQQKLAVASGYWPLLRFNPLLADHGKNPLQLDSRAPSLAVNKYMYNETRFSMLVRSDPETAGRLSGLAQQDVDVRWKHYADMAAVPGTETVAKEK